MTDCIVVLPMSTVPVCLRPADAAVIVSAALSMTCPLLRSDAPVIVPMRDDASDACCRLT